MEQAPLWEPRLPARIVGGYVGQSEDGTPACAEVVGKGGRSAAPRDEPCRERDARRAVAGSGDHRPAHEPSNGPPRWAADRDPTRPGTSARSAGTAGPAQGRGRRGLAATDHACGRAGRYEG